MRFVQLFVLAIVALLPGIARAQALACGSTIVANTTLTADVICNAAFVGNAITIGANNVVLDGGGFKVQLANAAAKGVRVTSRSGWTIQDLTVEQTAGATGIGVTLSNTTNGTIQDSTFASLGTGIDCPSTANPGLIVRRVSVANSGTRGMRLRGLTAASIVDQNTFDGSAAGLSLVSVTGPFTLGTANTFANVGALTTSDVILVSASSNVTISGLDLTPGTLGYSIRVSASPNTTITNNVLSGRSRGIYTVGVTNNTNLVVTGNDVSHSSGYGMFLDSVDTSLVLTGNTFDSSGVGLRLQDLAGPFTLSAADGNTFAGAGNTTNSTQALWLLRTSSVTVSGLDLSSTAKKGVGVYLEATTGTHVTNVDASGRFRGVDTTIAINPGLEITGTDVSGAGEYGMRLNGIDASLVLDGNTFDGSVDGLELEKLVGPWTMPTTNSFAGVGTTSTAQVLTLTRGSDLTIAGLDLSGSGTGYAIGMVATTGMTITNDDLSGRRRGISTSGTNTGGSIRNVDASGAVDWAMVLNGWTTLDLGDNDYSGSTNGLQLVGVTGPLTFDLFTSDFANVGTTGGTRAIKVATSTDLTLDGLTTDLPNNATAIEIRDSTNVTTSDVLACATSRGILLVNGQNVSIGPDVFLDADLYGIDIDAATDATAIGANVEVGGATATPVHDLGTNTTGSTTAMSDADLDDSPDRCDPCPNDPDITHLPPNCVNVDLCVGDDTTGDADLDGYCADTDCDDNEPAAFPGNPEICDGIDNNCAFGVDEGLPGSGLDTDGDGCIETACNDTCNGDGPDCDGDCICDTTNPDIDDDTVPNASDSVVCDPLQCQDLDLDTCDDCAVQGSPSLANDGADADADGFCDAADFEDDGGILLSAVAWSTGGIGSPSVLRDAAAGAPGPFVMVYETQTGAASATCLHGVWAIGLATSPDGKTWTDAGGPLLAASTPALTDWECVASQPTIVQHDGGPDIVVYFKAEDHTGYRGIGSFVMQWNGGSYAVTSPVVNTQAITVNFGFPKAVFDGGTYRVALTEFPNMYVTSGSITALGVPTQTLAPGFAAYGPDEVINPAVACDANGDFVFFVGGRDLNNFAAVLSQGLGRRPSTDFTSYGPGPEPLNATTKGDLEYRTWDVVRIGTADYALYYSEKTTTGKPAVRLARTSLLTDYGAMQEKACP